MMTVAGQVVVASTGLWIAVGVLIALLVAGWATGFVLLAKGKLSLDLDWGRSYHRLGPISRRVDAPRELVFELVREPYVKRLPAGAEIEVLTRDEGERLVVAAHHTSVHGYTARTVEIIEFDPPERVGFRHLHGPVPHATESFTLREDGDGTAIEYEGELGIDFFVLGRVAARRWVRPQWERIVAEHLDELEHKAERRAERRR